MAYDYAAIRAENKRKYGTDIGRIGPMLLANRYGDRTHFIFELLQNAEDALARRDGWEGPRSVEFMLSDQALRVSHYGTPFTEKDVRGICGIGEGTKDLTAIGRFGIGFKSVYAFTDCPEVHSGDEHFAIESFVWPKAIPAIQTEPGETVLRLPLRENDPSAKDEIASGLQRLGPRTLLFLRGIEEISWSVADGPSGRYLRNKPESLSKNALKVVVSGDDHATGDVTEETWLVFSREVSTLDGDHIGYAELAFRLEKGEGDGGLSVRAMTDSPLVVFFPTILPTNLGFLVQGPYRTTPSRDNVPVHDPWNKHLVKETATLLVETLRELRGLDLLNVDALRSLPLDVSRFPEGSMFASLFTGVREALLTRRLLPCFHGGHVAARQAKLARTQDLRELLSPDRLTAVSQADQKLAWLSEEITQDRTPELRRYLMHELGIAEIVPEALLPMLTKSFLEAQTDKWIVQLYGFLRGQPALQRPGRLNNTPLIRLEDGTHVTPFESGQPQAFLPGAIPTGFPTVRRSVCRTEEAVAFLKALGLTEPDPVDDVIANIVPKYQQEVVQIGDAEYQADIERLLAAFATDSNTQRAKLIKALRSARFIAAMDAGDGSPHFVKPTEAYQATQRLNDLFSGVHGVLMVDDSRDCLRGEDVRDPLEACGTALYLQTIQIEPSFTREEKAAIRREARIADMTHEISVEDFTLRGLGEFLAMLPQLPPDQARARATLLWQALCDVEDRRGAGTFFGKYRWFWYTEREAGFDAHFVRLLNETAWVPDASGTLQPPRDVVFEDIDPRWQPNPFLLSKVKFKPPVIAQLAKEAGIEPGVLDLLKKLGLTGEAELRRALGRNHEESNEEVAPEEITPQEPPGRLLSTQPEPTPPVGGPAEGGPPVGPPRSGGARRFVSYVAVNANEEEPDPDGLDHQKRLALEEEAIALVLSHESQLQRTPTNNPGFDLTHPGPDGKPVKWVEVKAMRGTLQDRPFGVTSRQFECAQEHGEAYWLYVVERAGSSEARIVPIQDPAGKARTFTFDHGWLAVAEINQ